VVDIAIWLLPVLFVLSLPVQDTIFTFSFFTTILLQSTKPMVLYCGEQEPPYFKS